MRSLLLLLTVTIALRVSSQGTVSAVMELTRPPAPGTLLRFAICPNINSFETELNAIVSSVPAQYPITRVTVENVPPGEYAVRTYVDENANGRMDVTENGLPKEQYGFSNDAMRTFSAPYFSQARFTVREGMNVLRIRMR